MTYKLKNRRLGAFPFPDSLFYFDENSIYRVDPRGQYALMTQAIHDFLQTDSLKVGGDTLYVCTDRVILNDPSAGDSIVEKLDPALLNVHYKGKIITYLSSEALKRKMAAENRPCYYIRGKSRL